MSASPLVKELLEAGVHFGHQTKRWNPKMRPFIFGSRAGIYIIDLEQTERLLRQACDAVEAIAEKGETILFVGTKKQAKPIIQEAAARCQMPSVADRWMGGTLTNFPTIKRNIDRLLLLRKQKAEGYFDRLTKKDATTLQRQMDKLEVNYAGLAGMTRLPSCLYVVDPKREQNAVHEAGRLHIPIVAICDTNADPDVISYPIPGNDDAIRAIRLITTQVAEGVLAGRRRAGVVIPLPAEEGASSDGAQSSDATASQAAE